MTKFRAIIFDLDDTLYLERDFVVSGFRAVAKWAEERLNLRSDETFEELWGLFKKGVRGDTFDQWLAARDLASTDLLSQMITIYRDHEPQLHLCPGVVNLLSRLRLNFKLGLLTDGYWQVQRRKIQALDLTSHFDAMVLSDEWGRSAWKPSVQPFQLMAEKLRVNPSESVYVGDNPLKDFLGARKAGFSSIRIRYMEGLHRDLQSDSLAHVPDLEIEDLACLDSAIARLQSTVTAF